MLFSKGRSSHITGISRKFTIDQYIAYFANAISLAGLMDINIKHTGWPQLFNVA